MARAHQSIMGYRMYIEWFLFGGLWFQHIGIVKSKNEYIRTPSHIWDEEPIVVPVTPAGMEDPWRDFTDGYLYGNLQFAGQNEFSWVVDVRSDLLGDQFWSIGMLINKDHVLTACRLFQILDRESKTTYDDYAVHYFSQHQEETPKRPTDSMTKELSSTDFIAGNVRISNVLRHPNCTIVTIEWDMALIQLRKEIHPYVPQVDFAPVPVNKTTAHILDYDLSKMYNDKVICYIASVGRNYRNLEGPDTWDFKTKTRVYWRTWTDCITFWRYICNASEESTCNFLPEKVTNVMCFQSRAKVGSVCDHDRGASLVCRGEIMGMVSRAATWKYCNNLLHVPFVAVKAHVMQGLVKGDTYEENRIWRSPSFNFTDILPVNPQPPDLFPPPTETVHGFGARTEGSKYSNVLTLFLSFCSFFL